MTRALRKDDGASSVEYGLLIAAIAAVIVAMVFAIGLVTKGNFKGTCDSWQAQQGGSAC